jgi:hypothetical protein
VTSVKRHRLNVNKQNKAEREANDLIIVKENMEEMCEKKAEA